MKIDDALQNVYGVALDTSIFIYFIENVPFRADKAEIFIRYGLSGRLTLITSTLTMTEVLVKPMRDINLILVKRYRQFLLKNSVLKLRNVDRAIAQSAAQLRAKHNLRTPDAIQIATALTAGADAFLTNDFQIKRINDLPILILDDLEL